MKLNLFDILRILLLALLFSLLALCYSCGAKKTDKTSNSEVSKAEITDLSKNDKSETTNSNIKIYETKSENNQDQTTIIEEIVEPLDTSKPATYTDKNGQKQELNNTKKTTKTTTKHNNIKTESKTETEASAKTDKKATKQNNIKKGAVNKKESASKHVDQKQWNPLNLSWFLLGIAIYLVVKYWSKITSKIWWL